jgi:ABC-type antimicrobial peptide transport system permease subunit
VFSMSITPRIEVIPVSIGISIGVALLASIFPVRRAVNVEPAIVLRGE